MSLTPNDVKMRYISFANICVEDTKIVQRTEESFKLVNKHRHKKDHVGIGPLIKFDGFRVIRDQVIDLET